MLLEVGAVRLVGNATEPRLRFVKQTISRFGSLLPEGRYQPLLLQVDPRLTLISCSTGTTRCRPQPGPDVRYAYCPSWPSMQVWPKRRRSPSCPHSANTTVRHDDPPRLKSVGETTCGSFNARQS